MGFWDDVKPGDPVMGKHFAVIQGSPKGTIICLRDEPEGRRYYYDPNKEMEGVHLESDEDTQGWYWKEVT